MTLSLSASANPELTRIGVVRELLLRHGLSADKRLGQHFLTDAGALRSIVEAGFSGIELPAAEVWEVGPGLGTLSVELAQRSKRLHCIELDRRMLSVLAETLAPFPHAQVHHQDALNTDWQEASPGALFVANLPYQVGTAVLLQVIASRRFARLVVLVQREVAERLVAKAGDSAFGSLSLHVAHHGVARRIRDVAPGAFTPAPKVTSAVVRIDLNPNAVEDPRSFTLIRDAFRHRRKTLLANLRAAGDAPSAISAALEQLNLDPRVRAERIDLETFRALAALLRSNR
jgi:16S rRNA (adenine1518-N6/adenine1519-N6)-dimethyltransferase